MPKVYTPTHPRLFLLAYEQHGLIVTYKGSDIKKIAAVIEKAFLKYVFNNSEPEMHAKLRGGIEATWTWKVMYSFMQNSIPGDVLQGLPVYMKRGDACITKVSMTHINPTKHWSPIQLSPKSNSMPTTKTSKVTTVASSKKAPSLKSLGFTPHSGQNKSLSLTMNLQMAYAVYEVLSGIGKDAKSSYDTDEQLYLAQERIEKFLKAHGVKL